MRRVLYPLWMNSMPECDGCGECCMSSHVGITHDEYWAIKDYCAAKGIAWDSDRPCGFLDADNRCRIYEVRPLVCRMFGTALEYPCLRCPEAAKHSFPPEEARRLGLAGFDALPLEAVSWEQVSSTYGCGIRRKEQAGVS